MILMKIGFFNKKKGQLTDETILSKIDSHFDKEKKKIEELKSTKTINPLKKIQIAKDIKSIEKDIKAKKKEIEKQIKLEQKRKEQKNALIGAVAMMVLSFGILGITSYRSKINKIKFINSEDNVYIGDVIDLQYQVRPSSAEYENDEISIIFDNINLLEQQGNNYRAIEEGTVKASILYKDNTYDQKIISILPIEVKSIDAQNMEIGVNIESDVNIKFFPENSTHKQVNMSSSNNNIVKVIDGKLVGVSEGSTKINVKSVDGPETSFNVNVVYVEPEKISITGIKNRYEPGMEGKLSIIYTPKEISNLNPEVKWSSSNGNVISVDDEGNIKCIQRGTATLNAYYSDEVYVSQTINVVYPNPTKITLSGNSSELYKGYTMRLNASIEPNLVEDNTIEWSSSDESKATVNAYGTVTAISYGEVFITAKTINGITDKYKILVTEAPVVSNNNSVSRGGGGSSGNVGISGSGSFYTSDTAGSFHTQNPCHGHTLSNPIMVTLEEAYALGKTPCYWCAKGY